MSKLPTVPVGSVCVAFSHLRTLSGSDLHLGVLRAVKDGASEMALPVTGSCCESLKTQVQSQSPREEKEGKLSKTARAMQRTLSLKKGGEADSTEHSVGLYITLCGTFMTLVHNNTNFLKIKNKMKK